MPVRKSSASQRVDAVARAITVRVLDGDPPVGSLLPTDAELAATHAVPLATARAALKRLEQLGLITRTRSGPARVVSGEVRALYGFTASYDGTDAAAGQYAAETTLQVERRRRVSADAELAMLLGVPEGSAWLSLSGPRLVDDGALGPLAWVDVWLDREADTDIESSPLTPSAIAALTGAPVAEIVEEFSAHPLTPAQARLLRARAGAAALHALRRYLRANGTLLAAVRDVHPAERASVTVRLVAS